MKTGFDKYMNLDLIFPHLNCRSKKDLIDDLSDKITKVVPELVGKNLSRLIHERESQTSTAIGEELAFPHCRINSIDDIFVVVGICRKGIEYNAPDGKKVKFIFMVIGPESKSNEYLSILAHIAKAMFNSKLRKQLLLCKNAIDIFECLSHPISGN